MNRLSWNMIRAASALILLGAAGLATAQDSAVGHMHEHYEAILKIQKAVIAGSMEEIQEPAFWLSDHKAPPGLPADWEEYVDEMRFAATDALDAEDLAAAAKATSALGLACGSCHAANKISVTFDEVAMPSDKETTQSHMQRHQWAADRMWEGLIGPSGYSWSRGANLLFESPIKPDTLGDDALVGMSRRIHQLAANATTVSEPAEMAEIYAEFIGNCASCHSALGGGPGN